jgi:hypothetical protein
VIVAGRGYPSAEWRALATWGSVVIPLALRNFTPVEATEYLQRRNIRGEVARSLCAFSHGHPLALALAADGSQKARNGPISVDQDPDIVRTLYDYFARGVSDPTLRAALEVCAVLHTTTEAMLAVMLEGDAVRAFRWLAGLSFVELGRRGLLPHDLARDVILAELRWRNPERLAALTLRAQTHYASKLSRRSGPELAELLGELTFVFGHNPKLCALLANPEAGLTPDELRSEDEGTIRDAVLRHEGPTSLAALDHWLRHQPASFQVVRDASGAVAAFGLYLRLDAMSNTDLVRDPVAHRTFRYARQLLGATPQLAVLYTRCVIACDTGHAPALATGMCMQIGLRLLFSAGIKLSFVRHREGEKWRAFVEMSGGTYVSELRHVEDGHTYEVTMVDLRDISLIDWIARCSERNAFDGGGAPEHVPSSAPLVALARDEFANCVRTALRAMREPLMLANNPLVQCQAVIRRSGFAAPLELRAASIRAILEEEFSALRGSTRGDLWHRVLSAAYAQSAGKHEQIASDLGMSYTTFRRHLRAATKHIVERMWEQEARA